VTDLPPLIPRETIFGNPEKADPQISPDGTRMAYLAPVDGVLNVWVGKLDSNTYAPVTQDTDRGVRLYFWAYDGRHLLYLQDKGGDENWRLYKVDLTNNDIVDLTPFDKVQVQVVGRDKGHPHELLIGLNKDDERFHDVYRLDLRTNELKLVAKNPGDVVGWTADSDLRVRAAMASTADGGMELRVRGTADDEWRQFLEWKPDDAMTSAPIGFTKNGTALYVVDPTDANAAQLYQIDIESGTRTKIAGDPDYDVADVLIHPDTREIQMVAWVRTHEEWEVFDESIRNDIDAVRALNPGDFGIHSRTLDDSTWIVGFTEDDRPVSYHRYDRATGRSTFLFYNRPSLAKYALASMQPISFASRDGLTVHGYLTVPPGFEDQRLPMVLLVHGGPWHRDVWGYDPEAQWLANRGYACLQINFRGSTGYGKVFLNAGDKEWGGNMHNDLADAVQWAVDQGVADRDRIAIYGGSYGGYAALVGATFTPDLFKCAVDIVGPSNLITFIETIPPYWESYLEMLHRRVGHPERDKELLESRSPLNHVDRIRIPLLIAQGANDPRVKESESEQIVAAMKTNGIDHEYLLFPDEGHGFAKPENRLKFYAAAERFLAKHMGGRFEE
jgi:dipeptidyl aminopeptidase/acylaminoacyl peptidase